MKPALPGPSVRRAVVMLPNGATLLNLFFGIFAIVSAARGRFEAAGWFVVLGGLADALDGRIARATGTGSRFGEELDSLVDAISFGLAPALIMYFAVLNKDGWDWLFVFLFTSSAVMRLARFNVEQAGRKKTHFHGLPSPVAGMTLATYYWFSQTSLYNETVIFFTANKVLADFPWHVMLRWLMVGLAFLMISNIPYPAVPTIGFRSPRQLVGALIVAAVVIGLRLLPNEFFFPVLLAYVVVNAAKWALLGFFDRVPTGQSIFLEEETDDTSLAVAVPPTEFVTGRRRRRRGRHRGEKPTPLMNPAVDEPRE
ncbi:MAG: CDP-diacylglycerol--serine O-phosphatidyltransferase [Gemmatimonadaceae bacterium]